MDSRTGGKHKVLDDEEVSPWSQTWALSKVRTSSAVIAVCPSYSIPVKLIPSPNHGGRPKAVGKIVKERTGEWDN